MGCPAGCHKVDTTDGLHAPKGLSRDEAMASMRRSYQQIMEVAEAYGVTVNIEPHGYFTTDPDALEETLGFVDSPLLGVNLDTGNTFIAGRDPVAFSSDSLIASIMSTSRTSVSHWPKQSAVTTPASR